MTYRYRPSGDWRDYRGSGLGAVDELRGAAIPLPEAVEAEVARHDALKARAKALPSDRDARRPTVEALMADPSANIAKPATAELVRDVEAEAARQAVDESRAAVTSAVVTNSDAILADVRRIVFDPALETLQAAAKASASYSDAGAALRDGDHDAAQALAGAAVAAEQVERAYRLRRALYPGARIADLEGSVWRNHPDVADHLHGEGLDRWIAGLRADPAGELWLPTFTEADARARELDAERKARRRQRQQAAEAAVLEAAAARTARKKERAKAKA